MKRTLCGVAAICAVSLPSTALAQEMDATVKFTATGVIVDSRGAYRNLTLSINGPNEFQATTFSEKGAAELDLRRIDTFDDGVYGYSVTAATDTILPVRTGLNNGRDDIAKERRASVSLSGVFTVKNGKIVIPEDIEEEK